MTLLMALILAAIGIPLAFIGIGNQDWALIWVGGITTLIALGIGWGFIKDKNK